MRIPLRGLRRYGLALGSVALAVAVLELLGSGVNAPIAAQVLLLVLIIDGSLFGTGPAIAASIGAAAGFSRYFITPTGFAFGVRAAWAFPFGDLNPTETLGSNVSGQLPIWLEAGWRFTRNIYAGIYGQYAFGFSNNCPIASDCSTKGYRLGIEGIYNLAPDAWLQPWAGLGFGYEWLNVSRAGQDSNYKGFELAYVQAGVDLAVSKQLSVGPFGSVSFLGKYTSQSANGVSNDISATHEWVQVGLKATFKM